MDVFWPFHYAIWPFDSEWLVAGRAPEANRHPERDGRVPQRSDQAETADLITIMINNSDECCVDYVDKSINRSNCGAYLKNGREFRALTFVHLGVLGESGGS